MLGEGSLKVSDSLKGTFRHAVSRFYFHPNLIVTLETNILEVKGKDFVLRSDLTGETASLVDSHFYPEFGLEIPNKSRGGVYELHIRD